MNKYRCKYNYKYKYKYKYANLITLGGIVFMGGVRSMLTDELEHWETVLLARRRPSH